MAGRQKNLTPPKPFSNGHDDPATIGDEPEVVIEGDPAVDVDTGVTDKGIVDPGVESLEEQLAAEKRKRELAEQDRDRLAGERAKDQQVLTDSRLLVIDSTITTKEGQKEAIKQRILAAKEAGDFEAETAAIDELQTINIDLRTAKLGKDRLEREIEEAKAAPATTDGDPLEGWLAAQKDMHPRSKQWIRDHREIMEDPVRSAELTVAHQRAIRKGIRPNTDDYFEFVETDLGLREAGDDGVVAAQREEPAPRRQADAPAAPVSRSSNMGGAREIFPGIVQTGPGKYKVSKEVADAAAMSGVTVAEYIEQAKGLKRGSDGQLH